MMAAAPRCRRPFHSKPTTSARSPEQGTDAVTPAVDNWNEVTLPTFPYLADLDGVKSVPAAPTKGKTIGDQLVRHGLSWKSYQEDLPITGADLVNYSNGTASNLTDFTPLAPLTSSSVVQAYAVKHNPFAYFKSVQEGTEFGNSLENIVGFEGPRGLYADLARGDVPSLAFIAPNQCNDQHGRGNGDAFCAFDPGIGTAGLTNGTQVGLNPGLILQGDTTIERLVKAIKHSPVWHDGRTAIVIVWDENDYSGISTHAERASSRRRIRTWSSSPSRPTATRTTKAFRAAGTTTAFRCSSRSKRDSGCLA